MNLFSGRWSAIGHGFNIVSDTYCAERGEAVLGYRARQDYRLPSHISKMVLPTVKTGPMLFPTRFASTKCAMLWEIVPTPGLAPHEPGERPKVAWARHIHPCSATSQPA